MPIDFTKIALLDHLHGLRRERRRLSASIISTYSANLPFYETVVLRHLEAAGSRFNVVLADAGELSKSFLADSTRPRSAGLDYLLLPVHAGGAFHPKIIALFSDEGMAVAIGSHNLTEAGLGRNGEISATFGFDGKPAPASITRPVTDYLVQCAAELAPGDLTLSQRLADRLQLQSRSGSEVDDEATFVGVRPGGPLLLDAAFKRDEVAAARRVLVLGPYFDDGLHFLSELRKRAPRAEIVVAIQPDYSIMKHTDRLPARTRLCNANSIALRRSPPFIHAKAVVLDSGKRAVVAVGSANPSSPAWPGDRTTGNFEAEIVIRGDAAVQTIRDLALDRLWDAPNVSKQQLKQIELRSQVEGADKKSASAAVSGLWRQGWVQTKLNVRSRAIGAIRKLTGSTVLDLGSAGATITDGMLRFAAPEAGVFAVELADRPHSLIVIASSAAELGRSLVSGGAARLIDELGRLGDGTAPGEELLNLCEKVLLQADQNDDNLLSGSRRGRGSSGDNGQKADDEPHGPRGISIYDSGTKSRRTLSVNLDISAIITLLLKELDAPTKENADPTAEDPDNLTEDEKSDGDGETTSKGRWEDIVRAVRPRVRRLLNRLAKRIEEEHSAKWKYERVLVTLALLKRLRKYHPGTTIPYSARPERLVDDDQLRDAFKLAMHCWFARDGGVVVTLERMGGIDSEHEIMGRALLLWIAYESGADVARPTSFNIDPEELRAFQADRTDALISAIAACATPETLKRARREIFDRGEWSEARDRTDRIDAWLSRHAKVGEALQKALMSKRPPSLPVIKRPPSMQDIVIWNQEPGWPRFPEVVTGRIVHLADVGDAEAIKIAQQFVQPIDVDRLGISGLLAASGSS